MKSKFGFPSSTISSRALITLLLAVCFFSARAELPSKLAAKSVSSFPVKSAGFNFSPGVLMNQGVDPAGCVRSGSIFEIMAIPCNGVSVTSISFNAAGRTIESGTNNTVGVVYRYSNAGTAPDGTVLDALVTVLSYANNQDASPTGFGSADIPGATTGFEFNLQPNLDHGGTLSGIPWNASINYRIQFVVTGTTTPKVINVAATSVDNDGASFCGLLRESVTYSAGFNQILINAVTNQTVMGNTVQGPSTTQAGIGTSPDYANSALYINVSQFEWQYSFTTSANCNPGNPTSVRYGSLNLTCQIDFNPSFASVSLSGTVFDDPNGLSDSTVNGTGIGMPGGTQLYANLVDSNGNVYASVPLAANGTYLFPSVVAGTYTVRISAAQGIESNAAPANTLPAGWINRGENLGAGPGSDGTINGSLPVTISTTNVTNANFGISLAPSAANVIVSGRVMSAEGRPIMGVYLVLTDSVGNARTSISSPFGYFSFEDVEAGQIYFLTPSHRRYQFDTQVLTVDDTVSDLVIMPIK